MNYRFWFAGAPGINPKEKRELLHLFGKEEELYRMPENQVRKLFMFSEATREALIAARKDEGWKRGYESFLKQGTGLVCWNDKEYPERLRRLMDPPYCLWLKGSLPEESQKIVAIVGARNCSGYGEATARTIARELAKRGAGIISGMAYGIDAAAHTGALPQQTWAVLGCGVDICYPNGHRRLYEQIAQSGGVLSEAPLGCPPLKHLFPRRNRIISGLADAVVVVEARKKSGSLITADLALEQGKLVCAVPGRISDELSYGANWLLSQGAYVLYSLEEFFQDLNLKKEAPEKFMENSLEKNERLVYSVLDFTPKHLEALIGETGLGFSELLDVLYGLKEQGLVREIHQNYYIKSGIG